MGAVTREIEVRIARDYNIYEEDEQDEARIADWVTQANNLPGAEL